MFCEAHCYAHFLGMFPPSVGRSLGMLSDLYTDVGKDRREAVLWVHNERKAIVWMGFIGVVRWGATNNIAGWASAL